MGRCELCGAEIDGSSLECRNVYYGELLSREYEDPVCGGYHLLSVDCYALQHSEAHGPRSNAYHLLRLGWLLFGGGDPDIRQEYRGPMPFILKTCYREFPFLPPPPAGNRGEITVVDLLEPRSREEHKAMAYKWGRSVWDAYEDHHGWAVLMLRSAGVGIK